MVEDNEINIQVASFFLAKLGHVVDTASCGEEALELSAARPYHAILMDCHMPGLDGFETATAIRKREAAARVRPVYIIAVTADVIPGSRERCLAAGMDDYLSKPLQMKAFEAVIGRAATRAEMPFPL